MNEKRVGIANFSYFMNYGAVLQSYALIKTMNRLPCVQAELIDYRPIGYQNFFPIWSDQRDLWKNTNALQKKRFMEKEKRIREFHFRYNHMNPEILHSITANGFDYCCVGSDQVWNYVYSMWHNYEHLLPHVSPGIKKIAYAASIGQRFDFLPDDSGEDPFMKYLPSFDAISVREKEHIEFVKEKSGKHVSCVLDPTLLLDAEDYLPIIADHTEKPEQPYLMVYYLAEVGNFEEVLELSNLIARKYGLRIVHTLFDERGQLFYNNNGCMYYGGVEDFLWYMKNASFVVTNTYHGTIFSIQFERPFYVFLLDGDARVETLLSYADFHDRIVGSHMMTYDEINMDVDFAKIKQDIYSHRNESMRFLKNALDIK